MDVDTVHRRSETAQDRMVAWRRARPRVPGPRPLLRSGPRRSGHQRRPPPATQAEAPEPLPQEAPVAAAPLEVDDARTPPAVGDDRPGGPLGPLVRLGARTLAVTTLALALVAVLLGVLLLTSGGDDDGGAGAREDDRADALTAARSFATALTSYDYRRLDAGFAAVQEQSTGSFKEEYGKTTAALRALLTKQKAVSKPTVLGSGVQSLGDGQAVVLLFVDQTITNASTQQPRVDRNRLVLTMTEVDGAWLASAVSLT